MQNRQLLGMGIESHGFTGHSSPFWPRVSLPVRTVRAKFRDQSLCMTMGMIVAKCQEFWGINSLVVWWVIGRRSIGNTLYSQKVNWAAKGYPLLKKTNNLERIRTISLVIKLRLKNRLCRLISFGGPSITKLLIPNLLHLFILRQPWRQGSEAIENLKGAKGRGERRLDFE